MNSFPRLLVLVRHAESTRNVAEAGQVFFADDSARGQQKGEADAQTRLTDAGWVQARAAGTSLRAWFQSFDTVFHSGYRRTQETAEGIVEAWPREERAGINVRPHLFLRERDSGYSFNMTAAEAQAAFPWLQDYRDEAGPFFARSPGGESLADVAERVQHFFEFLQREQAQRVLIVTHGGTMRMFRYWLEGWSYEEVAERWRRGAIPNCCVVAYSRDSANNRLLPVALPPSKRHLTIQPDASDPGRHS